MGTCSSCSPVGYAGVEREPIINKLCVDLMLSMTASSLYVASYPYVATHVGDVTFNAGDVIRVTEINDNGWWRGTVNASGLTGFFPGSYLKSVMTPYFQL